MELGELAQLAADEQKAEAFLQSPSLLQRFTHCPYCQSEHIGRVQRCFYECYWCRRKWSPRKGSLLEGFCLPPGKLLLALKLFELEVSARRATRMPGLAYNTVLEMNAGYFGGCRRGKRGRGDSGKLPVFGILKRGSRMRVEVVPDARVETLLREAIRKVRQGSLIDTDRFRSDEGPVCYGFCHGEVRGLGVRSSASWFPLRLKELEFRVQLSAGRSF